MANSGEAVQNDANDVADLSTLIGESVVHKLQHRCAALVSRSLLRWSWRIVLSFRPMAHLQLSQISHAVLLARYDCQCILKQAHP